MNYEILTRFRDAIQALGSLPCDTKTTTTVTQAIFSNGAKLPVADIIHELQHLTSVAHRFRVVRHLPSNHYISILYSNSLHPHQQTQKKRKRSEKGKAINNILAAQYASLTLDWSNSSPSSSQLTEQLRNLRTLFSSLFLPGQSKKYILFPETLRNLTRQAQEAVLTTKETVKLIAVDEALDPIEEDICGQWAQLRGIVSRIMPLITQARKLYLDVEIQGIEALLAECDILFRLLVHRDVDIPDVRTPLGAGTARRLPAFIPEHFEESNINDDDDDDSDEWEDPVEVSADQLESDEDERVNQSSKERLRKIADLSKCFKQGNASDSRDDQRFQQGARASCSSQHNNAILDALEASSKKAMDSSVRNPQSSGRASNKKKKDTTKSVHERLRSKLGIRKPKKRAPQ